MPLLQLSPWRERKKKIGEKNKTAPRENWEREPSALAPTRRRFVFFRRFLFARETNKAGKERLPVVHFSSDRKGLTSFKLVYKACRLRREGLAILLGAIPKHPSNTSTDVSWPADQFNDSILVLHLVSISRVRSCQLEKKEQLNFVLNFMAKWLVRGTEDRKVRVLALAEVTVFSFWARPFTLAVPLSTQEYKWVLVNCQGNLTKCW